MNTDNSNPGPVNFAPTGSKTASADCLQRVVSGIIIPQHPPPGIVEALRHFVEAIEGYGESGTWPDNGTLRRLADEGRDALNCGHSANADICERGK